MKKADSTSLPAAPGAVESGGKPSMPPSGESTYSSPSVVVVWRSIQCPGVLGLLGDAVLFLARSDAQAAADAGRRVHDVHPLLAGGVVVGDDRAGAGRILCEDREQGADRGRANDTARDREPEAQERPPAHGRRGDRGGQLRERDEVGIGGGGLHRLRRGGVGDLLLAHPDTWLSSRSTGPRPAA